MSQQQKEDRIKKFEGWLCKQTEADLVGLVYGKGLNQSKIAEQAGIGLSSVKNNPHIKSKRESIEQSLREKGYLPTIQEAERPHLRESQKKAQFVLQADGIKDERIRTLEQRCMYLEAYVRALENRVQNANQIAKRHQETVEVINELQE